MRRYRELPWRWVVVLPLSVGIGMVFSVLGVPAGWILAGIIGSGAAALLTGRDLKVSGALYTFGRGVIGIIAALPLISTIGPQMASFLLPGIIVATVTLVLALGSGLLLSRFEPALSRETGILAMLPGGASQMPILAEQLEADYRYVALSQYLRLLVVSATLPMVTHFLSAPGGGDGAIGKNYHFSFPIIVVLVAIAFLGGKIGSWLHLPAAAVLGPMLTTLVVGLLLPDDISLQPPTIFLVVAFLCIGWICGGGLSVPALKLFARQLPATFVFIILMMAQCAACGALLAWWLGLSFFEGYLATTPGALETVLALSAEGGGGETVVPSKAIRLILVLLVAGWLPNLLRGLDGMTRGKGTG